MVTGVRPQAKPKRNPTRKVPVVPARSSTSTSPAWRSTTPLATSPDPFYVTNGLLTVELISGKMQTGNSRYETRYPANIPLASDNNDTNAPTYASFSLIANSPLGDHPFTDHTGGNVTAGRQQGRHRLTDSTALDKYERQVRLLQRRNQAQHRRHLLDIPQRLRPDRRR